MKTQVQTPQKTTSFDSLFILENKRNYFILFLSNIVFFILMTILGSLLVLIGAKNTSEADRTVFFAFSILFSIGFITSMVVRILLTYKFRRSHLGSWNFAISIILIAFTIGLITLFSINYAGIATVSTVDSIGSFYLFLYIAYLIIIFSIIVFIIWYDAIYLSRGHYVSKAFLLKYKKTMEKKAAIKRAELKRKEKANTYNFVKFKNKIGKIYNDTDFFRKLFSWYYMDVLVSKIAKLILKCKEISNNQIISKLSKIEREKSKYIELLSIFDKGQQDVVASMSKKALSNSKFQNEIAKRIKAREEEMKKVVEDNAKESIRLSKEGKKNKLEKSVVHFFKNFKNLFSKKKKNGKNYQQKMLIKTKVQKSKKPTLSPNRIKIFNKLSYSVFRVRKALGLINFGSTNGKKYSMGQINSIDGHYNQATNIKKTGFKKIIVLNRFSYFVFRIGKAMGLIDSIPTYKKKYPTKKDKSKKN